MKHIEEKNARDFVYSNSDTYFSPEFIKGLFYALVFLSLLINMICMVIKGRALYIGFAADILLVVMILLYLYSLLAWKPEKFSTRFTLTGAVSTVISLMFLMVAVSAAEAAEWPFRFELASAAVLFCVALINIIATIKRMNSGKYADPQPRRPNKAAIFASIGGVCGIPVGAMLTETVSQGAIVSIIFMIFYAVSLIFSYGSVYFLKSILIRRFAIPSDGFEAIIETDLREYKGRPFLKKIGSAVVFCLVTLIYIFIVRSAYLEP